MAEVDISPLGGPRPLDVTRSERLRNWHAACVAIAAAFVFWRCVVKRIFSPIGFVVLLAASALAQTPQYQAFGQQPQVELNPALPATILGPQLIVWSELQKPQPVPQPVTPGTDPSQQQQKTQQPGEDATGQSQQQPAAQTFTGTVIKDGDKYVLKTSGTTYQLDDQERAKPYEGKPVKIMGSLDASSNILTVTSIQLMS
jgi:hypothetical protein